MCAGLASLVQWYSIFTTSCNAEGKSLKRDMASLIDQRMLFQSWTGYLQ